MSVDSIRFRNQVKQIRQALAKQDCITTDVLLSKYKLSMPFLEQLCNVGLLTLDRVTCCKGSRWINERAMPFHKFMAIASQPLPAVKSANQLTQPSPQSPQDPHDSPIHTPFLGQVIRSRKSLTMGLKFTKGQQLSGVLSWYSSHPSGVIGPINGEGRRRYYEQEVFELDGKMYRIVDLEDHLLKAIEEFFDKSVKLTIQRIHHE
jgi:hypothetical protein